LKELKGFRKILIRKNEKETISFFLTATDLSYYHSDLSYSFDNGNFELFIGPNSAEGKSVKFSVY
jgi:beta-glucosidase